MRWWDDPWVHESMSPCLHDHCDWPLTIHHQYGQVYPMMTINDKLNYKVDKYHIHTLPYWSLLLLDSPPCLRHLEVFSAELKEGVGGYCIIFCMQQHTTCNMQHAHSNSYSFPYCSSLAHHTLTEKECLECYPTSFLLSAILHDSRVQTVRRDLPIQILDSWFLILDLRPVRMVNRSDLSCAFPENARPTMSTLLFLPCHRAVALDSSFVLLCDLSV